MDTDIGALTTVFTEFYYWITVALMFLIHVGFCMYEVGASRQKNHLHTLLKNTMLIPLVTITWFFFGWWIYWGVPQWPIGSGVIDPDGFGASYVPWGDGMGTNLGDRLSAVFWAAFLLFSWTAASIVSGAVIERIRVGFQNHRPVGHRFGERNLQLHQVDAGLDHRFDHAQRGIEIGVAEHDVRHEQDLPLTEPSPQGVLKHRRTPPPSRE